MTMIDILDVGVPTVGLVVAMITTLFMWGKK